MVSTYMTRETYVQDNTVLIMAVILSFNLHPILQLSLRVTTYMETNCDMRYLNAAL